MSAGAGDRGETLESGVGESLLVGQDALVVGEELLALQLEAGLELGFLGSLSVTVLLSPQNFLFTERGGLLSLLSEGSGFGGESILDSLVHGVNRSQGLDHTILGLGVTGMNCGSVEPTLADDGGQVGSGFRLGDLARD